MNTNEIADVIAQAMAAKDLSVSMVSEAAAMPATLVEAILSGRAKLPLEHVEKLANVLAVGVRELAGPALRQHFSEDAVKVLLALSQAVILTEAEREWLELLRTAAPDELRSPSRIGKRLIHSLLGGYPS